jgi:hypothetical protein
VHRISVAENAISKFYGFLIPCQDNYKKKLVMIFFSCLFQDVKNIKRNIFSFRWNVKKVVERAQGWSLILSINNVEKEKPSRIVLIQMATMHSKLATSLPNFAHYTYRLWTIHTPNLVNHTLLETKYAQCSKFFLKRNKISKLHEEWKISPSQV